MEPYAAELIRQAHAAIWRLFDAELIDEDLATVALLSIAIGYRRVLQQRTDGTLRMS